MVRFRDRFENKTIDGNSGLGEKKQNDGELSRETLEEADKIGFDDEVDIINIDNINEENRVANEQVEAELNQYYNDEITYEELRLYLISKINDIYGEELKQGNILIDSFVEGFLSYYEFNGAESYRQLAKIAEETILRRKENKSRDNSETELCKKSVLETLSEVEYLKLIIAYRNMSNQGELSANAYVCSQAKKMNIDKKELLSFILEKGKEQIAFPEKVLHYHRTSMKSFEQIMQTGYLLNRKNMQLNGIDISGLSGSSSENVQFSRDIYNEDGGLLVDGYDNQDNLGSNSTDIVLVMGPELIQEDTYNCLSFYPTVEKADVRKCCVAVLVKDAIIQTQVESVLNGIDVPIKIMLQEDFDRDIILEELNKNDTSKQAKK